MSSDYKIWVEDCPRIGQRVVFQNTGHKGPCESSWQDGVVIATAAVPKATHPWCVKVEYPTTARSWFTRRPIIQQIWCCPRDIMGVVNDDTDIVKLERMYEL